MIFARTTHAPQTSTNYKHYTTTTTATTHNQLLLPPLPPLLLEHCSSNITRSSSSVRHIPFGTLLPTPPLLPHRSAPPPQQYHVLLHLPLKIQARLSRRSIRRQNLHNNPLHVRHLRQILPSHNRNRLPLQINAP